MSDLVFCDAFKSGAKNAIALHRELRKSLQSMEELLEADAKSTEPKWTKDEREAALQALTLTRLISSITAMILGLSVVGLGTLVLDNVHPINTSADGHRNGVRR